MEGDRHQRANRYFVGAFEARKPLSAVPSVCEKATRDAGYRLAPVGIGRIAVRKDRDRHGALPILHTRDFGGQGFLARK